MSDSEVTTGKADAAFGRGRPVAVTGATGFLGSHVVSQLVGLGAQVAILVRDEVARSPISDSWAGQVAVVRGAVEDQSTVERLLGEYEARTVLPIAAQSQVGVANRNPVATYEANVAGTWAQLEAVRRTPRVEQDNAKQGGRRVGKEWWGPGNNTG